ncbi:NUDIX hydrolase [Lentibacter algarum]|uniref:NUDIX hydrolase n=1 Tax=Lentibacter algarum TaxID=576131 RepID=UPI001C0793C5|nr:NUDIX hydrolase [Lentibacter algarum]MBU2980919.1 NUDIX hydrolase [Lentibacter algarum]
MTLQNIKQLPISLKGAGKTDVRGQFAALCYRIRNDKPEVLLITSRGSQRWIIPKGWPMHGKTPGECALQEAWEEAGVKGKAIERCLGIYSYNKFIGPEKGIPCVAMVYPVRVKALAESFPEKGQRRRKWFSLKKAAAKVSERELKQILKTFDPKALKR